MSEAPVIVDTRLPVSFDATGMRSATEPPEARGVPRDGVRLLVATSAGVTHAVFADLARFLQPGDLVVVNTSATLAGSVTGRRRPSARSVTVHFSAHLPDGTWAVELRPGARARGPVRDAHPGEVVDLVGGALTLLGSYPEPGMTGSRLWRAQVDLPGAVSSYLARHGEPIAYDYVAGHWPLESYQTVFARDPGSAEMPSAGRPFSASLVTELVVAGIAVVPVTLHTGVSSLEKGEPPLPEPYRVPAATARLVNATRQSGGRIVAVGTTVTRALESVASPDGRVRAGHGWTDLVLGAHRPARVVDGLITGWHEPGASHLLLLEAVAGRELVATAYAEAARAGYLWHEFGDSALLLPD
ncbi:MAG: S-adenosylmethionine:tRNA ribosyltransferase-isomerase [Actinomycetes bacterium]